jgi:hypothetical protein
MTMKKALFYIAAGGWVISLLVHLLALGGVDVQESVPFVFLLHFGIFVVAIPTVILQKVKQSALPKPASRFSLLAEFQHAPLAVKVLAAAGFVYAIINFGLFMAAYPGSPSIHDGQYVLMNHSEFIRTLSAAEYHHARAMELRGFSGHWIAFYGVFAAGLYPPRKEEATVGTPPSA